MEFITLRVPLKIANVGVPMSHLDKVSLHEALLAFQSNCLETVDTRMEKLMQKPLHEQFVVVFSDVFNEVASVSLSASLYHEISNSGALGELCLSYLCNVSPIVTVPAWRVNSIEKEMLTASVQASIADFISEDSTDIKSSSECECGCNEGCMCERTCKED